MITKLVRFSILFAVFVLVSCQKNDTEELLPTSINQEMTDFDNNHSLNTESEEVYRIDNKIVSREVFQWNVEGMHYHMTIGEKDNPNSQAISYDAFTTETKYETFMYAHAGDKYARHKAITEHLRDYAETSGAIAYHEQHGEASQAYLDYEKRYLAQNLTPEEIAASQQRGFTALIYRDRNCRRIMAATLPLIGMPFFPFFNNQASSFQGAFIGGIHFGYNRTYYRQRILSTTVWAFNCVNFPPAIDNRMSSWWNFGI